MPARGLLVRAGCGRVIAIGGAATVGGVLAIEGLDQFPISQLRALSRVSAISGAG
jgi:hypothetical protein